jgi:hypothetical protein
MRLKHSTSRHGGLGSWSEAQSVRSTSITGNLQRSPHFGLGPNPDIGTDQFLTGQQVQTGISVALFDNNLVGEQLHHVGDLKAERLGGLEVDDELAFGRLKHRADRPAWRPNRKSAAFSGLASGCWLSGGTNISRLTVRQLTFDRCKTV